MSPVISFGIFAVRIYSICLLLAIFIGGFIIIREGKRHGYDGDEISDLLFYSIICGIIGARLYYCIFNFEYYSSDVLNIFMVWEGGLAIHGGIIGGLLYLIFYCKKHNKNLLLMLDFFVVGLILAQAIGRWGNFFNGEAHGGITTLSFLKSMHIPRFIIRGMYIDGNYYMPTFLFESLWCLVGFFLLLFLRHKSFVKVGYLTGFYLVWYSFERFFVEGMRTDSLMFFSLKIAQVVSVIMLLLGIVIIIYSYFNLPKYNLYDGKDDIND